MITLKAVPGTFGKKRIEYSLQFNASQTDQQTLIIFFHGCCGTTFDSPPTTYQLLAEFFRKEKGVSVGLFESSRKMSKLHNPELAKEFETFTQNAFGGKTLQQELADAEIAVSALLHEYKKNRQSFKLVFVGFSLGGLLASILSRAYHPETLMLFGSGLSFSVPKDLPILGKGMSKTIEKKLLAAARLYTGNLYIVRGSADDTATEKSGIQLFQAFVKARQRSLQMWDGVDHRFRIRYTKSDGSLVRKIGRMIRQEILDSMI